MMLALGIIIGLLIALLVIALESAVTPRIVQKVQALVPKAKQEQAEIFLPRPFKQDVIHSRAQEAAEQGVDIPLSDIL